VRWRQAGEVLLSLSLVTPGANMKLLRCYRYPLTFQLIGRPRF